jgi:hypothetical protein
VGREITVGQCVTVARLLQANLLSHWDHLGVVVDMPDPDAKAGFVAWLGRQIELYQRFGTGLTADEATGFRQFADELPEVPDDPQWDKRTAVAVVVLATVALSFASLRALAEMCGFTGWLGWVWRIGCTPTT